MKKFRITMNGKSYDLEVTELPVDGAPEMPQPAAAAPAPAPVRTPAPVPAPAKPAARKSAGTGGTEVTAPMNGSITAVNYKVGDTVEPEDAVVILEAMKMENEIFAGTAGVIASLEVKPGDSVQPGDVLFTVG